MKPLALVTAALLPEAARAAASYEVRPFEWLDAEHRVVIGVPSGFEDLMGERVDTRGAFRRAEVEKTVNAHVERMSARGDYPELKTVQYAFVTHQEAAFPDLFPKHARHTARSHGLDEPLAMPALKLINVRTQETMAPDWPILLADFPAEIDRLVGEFERWQTQSEDSRSVDDDGVLSLNIKNAAAATAENRATVAMFYAPWCHYSKLMLPLFGEASRLVSGWEAQGLVAPQTLRMAHVNVDQEGEMRSLQNVTTYPQLHVFKGKTKAAAQAVAHNSNLGNRRPMASPSEPFQGSTATAADIACHAASTYAWASRQPFALLADASAEEESTPSSSSAKAGAKAASKTNSALTFARLALEADKALVAGAEAAASKPPPEEDEPGFGEVHKRVVAVLAVVPDEVLENDNKNSSSNSAAKAAGLRVAKVVGGGHVFVGSGSSASCAEAAAALLKDAEAAPAADGSSSPAAAAAPVELAAKACEEFRRGPASGGVVVVHPSDGSVLSRSLPLLATALEVSDSAAAAAAEGAPKELADSSSDNEDDDDVDVAAWLRVAAWPAVNRFSTSAEQGERIRKSGVSTLCLLVGDEDDFMFEDFKRALESAARARLGAAHFLFANAATEPRVGALVKATRASWPRDKGAPPVVVLVSMAGGFAPRKLEGQAVTADGVVALLDAAKAEESQRRKDSGSQGEL